MLLLPSQPEVHAPLASAPSWLVTPVKSPVLPVAVMSVKLWLVSQNGVE